MATNRTRFTISADNRLIEQIEDFRYENRIPTMSKATETLIRLGLENLKRDKENKGISEKE